jgi:hypothetical protein
MPRKVWQKRRILFFLLATVRGIIAKIHQGIVESLVKNLASELQRGDLTRLSLMTMEKHGQR